jgi:hypothetical protein
LMFFRNADFDVDFTKGMLFPFTKRCWFCRRLPRLYDVRKRFWFWWWGARLYSPNKRFRHRCGANATRMQ